MQGVYVLGVSVWGVHVRGGYVLEPLHDMGHFFNPACDIRLFQN